MDNIWHAYFAFPVLFAVFFVAVGGVFTRSMMRRCKWRTKTALTIKRAHMTFAYLLVLCGAIAVTFGIIDYNGGKVSFYAIAHVVFFVFSFVILEAIYRMKLRKEAPFDVKKLNSNQVSGEERRVTVSEFKKRIENGEYLVILDDLVLDVRRFVDDHPGGKFSIENNIGRDVSKFFYGGYTQENEAGMWPHTHSSIAREVVSSLVCGRLVGEA